MHEHGFRVSRFYGMVEWNGTVEWNSGMVEWWNELIFNEGNDGQEMKLYFYLSILAGDCLLYTSPSPRDATLSRMPSSA